MFAMVKVVDKLFDLKPRINFHGYFVMFFAVLLDLTFFYFILRAHITVSRKALRILRSAGGRLFLGIVYYISAS